MQARIIIGERTPKRCRVIKEKIPSNLTVARYLFPVVSCGHFTSYRSHKYTLREKGVKQAVCACTFACDFLLFPLISSVLGTRISLAYICTEKRKKSIEELALCMREHFGMKPELPDLLHNGDVCRILNISKRTLQHYRDTSVLPFIQIGHKCYYKREDVEALLAKSNRK